MGHIGNFHLVSVFWLQYPILPKQPASPTGTRELPASRGHNPDRKKLGARQLGPLIIPHTKIKTETKWRKGRPSGPRPLKASIIRGSPAAVVCSFCLYHIHIHADADYGHEHS